MRGNKLPKPQTFIDYKQLTIYKKLKSSNEKALCNSDLKASKKEKKHLIKNLIKKIPFELF